MKILSELQPKILWNFFEDICNIPHRSGKEQKLIEYIVNYAKSKNLEYKVDEVGNVIIRKKAYPGLENLKTVILQAHLDMVAQKNSDNPHDFDVDPIKPRIEGNKVKATGTTLGADNGIGVAAALSILEEELPIGPIEVLLTVEEETGLTGASNLKPGLLKGEILINLDSENEEEITIGCAGGLDATFYIKYNLSNLPNDYITYNLKISGLKGGHSGVDIHLGRANANKLICKILREFSKNGKIRLIYVNGGNLRNAIPREANAIFASTIENASLIENSFKEVYQKILNDYKDVEDNINIELIKVKNSYESALTITDTEKVINIIEEIPNGVIKMSDSIPGLVETSNNIGIVATDEKNKQILISCLIRSSVEDEKNKVAKELEQIAKKYDVDVEFTGGYPGWTPNPNSKILSLAKETYKNIFGKEPKIKAVHAGLETGIIGGIYPNLDMISIGPTIRFPHSPDEEVEINSVQRFYTFLIEILKNIKKIS